MMGEKRERGREDEQKDREKRENTEDATHAHGGTGQEEPRAGRGEHTTREILLLLLLLLTSRHPSDLELVLGREFGCLGLPCT